MSALIASPPSMRFTLSGESFDLTPDLVRARLAGHAPEGIREYWVEVDGARWPVKQVISLATGAKRTRFQSRASRRWLRRLGLVVGTGASAVEGGTTRPAGVPHRAAFNEPQLEELEELEAIDVRVLNIDRCGA